VVRPDPTSGIGKVAPIVRDHRAVVDHHLLRSVDGSLDPRGGITQPDFFCERAIDRTLATSQILGGVMAFEEVMDRLPH